MFESPVITLNFIVDRLLQGKEENFQGQTDIAQGQKEK
jgi:hypothetical protein